MFDPAKTGEVTSPRQIMCLAKERSAVLRALKGGQKAAWEEE
jgi:hypothetical protein